MAFTNAQKVDIRRFCGYGVFGANSGQGFAYRYFQQYGTLEYRLNNLLPEEETVINTVYLPNLTTLESAIIGTSANLDTDQAGPWKHNAKEHHDRDDLFDDWRRRLCGFLGVEPGPHLSKGSEMTVVV
jgi:hypothetical protein